MTTLPRISVITVCRNAGATLERTLRSVLDQDYPALEYIVVDGGSTDGSQGIIERHADRLAHWSSEPDDGVAHAFNKGLARATGELVAFLNADDVHARDTLQRIAAAHDLAHPAILHGMLRCERGGRPHSVLTGDHRRLHREMTVNHMTCFVPREHFERWGGFRTDYRYAMDYELLLRFRMRGAEFRHLPEVLATMSLDGISARHWRRAYAEVARAKIELGLPPVAARARLAFMLVRGTAGRAADAVGLGRVRHLYRRYVARIAPSAAAPTNHA